MKDRTVRVWLVATFFALLLASTAAAVRSSTSGPALTGDPAGLQLVRQVNRSYTSVPAVRVDIAIAGGLVLRFTEVLRNGVVVAEQALARVGGAQPTVLVRRENEGTFVRDPNSSCWRFVPTSDPQALTDVGDPMLAGPGRVSKPRVTGQNGENFTMTLTRQGEAAEVVVNRKTSRLFRVYAPGYIARFTSLAKRPTLLVPKPRC